MADSFQLLLLLLLFQVKINSSGFDIFVTLQTVCTMLPLSASYFFLSRNYLYLGTLALQGQTDHMIMLLPVLIEPDKLVIGMW